MKSTFRFIFTREKDVIEYLVQENKIIRAYNGKREYLPFYVGSYFGSSTVMGYMDKGYKLKAKKVVVK